MITLVTDTFSADMRFKSQKRAITNQVDSVEAFIDQMGAADQCNVVTFEGKSSSGGSLFLMSNGTQVNYSWRDRAGLKEGWEDSTIPLRGSRKKIKALKLY